jgi:hypothetical protein
VETGLDLNDFTTLIFYNIGYSVFTFRQASRRSWRINQAFPRIEVYILYFAGTLQERALSLMASKLAVAGLIEGNFSDEGLAAMGDCNDLAAELAKELTSGIKGSVDGIADSFRKMAVIHDRAEYGSAVSEVPDVSEPVIEAEFKAVTVPDVAIRRPVEVNTADIIRFKSQNSKTNENQVSIFDLLAS